MPIKFPTAGIGLTRSGTYLGVTSGSWSFAAWVKADALPTGTDKYCIWHWGDIAHVNPYIAMYWDVNGVFVRVFDGTTTTNTSVVAQMGRYIDTWYYFSVTYNSGTNDLTFYFWGVQNPGIVKNLSLVVFVETVEYLGTDTGTSLGGLSFEYVRTFNNVASVGLINLAGPAGCIERGTPTAYGTEQTDTPLTDATDLNDVSGNSRNWTAIGTPTTDNPGPLDLVGGLWTTNFSGVTTDLQPFKEFTYTPNSAGVAAVGCSSSSAFGCGGDGQIWKQWDETWQVGAARFMIWPYITNPAAEYQIFTVQPYPYAIGTSGFQAVVYLEGDGRIRVRLTTGLVSTVDFYTDVGTIAVNGTAYAMQILWEINSLTQRVKLLLNNVEVLDTGNVSSTGLAVTYWNQVSLNVQTTGVAVFDNIEVDNVGDAEVWNRCTRNRVVNCSVVVVPANPGSGLYKMVLDKTNDTIYTDFDPETTENVAIPDPSITTALFGDEP